MAEGGNSDDHCPQWGGTKLNMDGNGLFFDDVIDIWPVIIMTSTKNSVFEYYEWKNHEIHHCIIHKKTLSIKRNLEFNEY